MTEIIRDYAPATKDFVQEKSARVAIRILVSGHVQGVGFRPFVYRLARHYKIGGTVRNGADGVAIEAEGLTTALDQFLDRLVAEAPIPSKIDQVTISDLPVRGRIAFAIGPSDSPIQPVVRLPCDFATCPECRADILEEGNRRHAYAFTNCTRCGPRYSIIDEMPYDRHATAMKTFAMCSDCRTEYATPHDRRFHAQPNACWACGPQVGFWDKEGRIVASPNQAIVAAAAALRQGNTVALKGLGGFQLLARADDVEAIKRLRLRKNRPGKPFAVMAPSLGSAEDLATLNDAERRLLQSPRNPIVLIDRRHGLQAATRQLSDEIAPNVGMLGLFLPTTPLHHLLLAELKRPVVATSGNLCEEPIITDEREALRQLAGIADFFLVHDRPIVRHVDDSVVRVIGEKETVFRLARGYAPQPLTTLEGLDASLPPILATGGHQKSAIALWTGAQAVLGQHIGELDHRDSRTAFEVTTRDLTNLYQCDPHLISCDLHPDYFTTRWAMAQETFVVQVQHHHAHAVSCMVENGLLGREVLAVVWDGTGYGTDGVIWGGEILWANSTSFRRVASLLPFPLPGGETAIRRPNRSAFGVLWVALGMEVMMCNPDLLRRLDISPCEARVLDKMIRDGVNTPWTSSMGRLFDAVAAMVLRIHQASYEGEPAVWLEAIAEAQEHEGYSLPLLTAGDCPAVTGDKGIDRGDWRPMLSAVLRDLARNLAPSIISAQFHNALVRWAANVAAEQLPSDIVLSGGCFQNRFLTERMLDALRCESRRVHTHGEIPPGDGGLAAGQLAVAMCRSRRRCP